MTDSSELAVHIVDACVDYPGVRAVDRVSLELRPHTIHVLAGHSGSGKTTLLRAIAGFEPLTSGQISVAGRRVDDGSRAGWVPPERRKIGFVFQDYALFTHLDAAHNIAFGAPGGRAERRVAAQRWLQRVHLPDHAARRPGQLSGGEQQRVALARALAQSPALVLLDEPFSNLDPHLRRQVREDTVALIRENQATAVFVTHDVEEAFAIGDQISVLQDGRIVQSGTPRELYDHPVSAHVARLAGPATFVPIDAVTVDGRVSCCLGEVDATGDVAHGALLVVRPEQVEVGVGDDATIVRRRFLGPVEELELSLASGERLVARVPPGAHPDDSVSVAITAALTVVPSE